MVEFVDFWLGVFVGVAFIAAIVLLLYSDGTLRRNIDNDLLDEICTELAGKEAEYDPTYSDRQKIVCVAPEEQIKFKHGRIVFRGFEDG